MNYNFLFLVLIGNLIYGQDENRKPFFGNFQIEAYTTNRVLDFSDFDKQFEVLELDSGFNSSFNSTFLGAKTWFGFTSNRLGFGLYLASTSKTRTKDNFKIDSQLGSLQFELDCILYRDQKFEIGLVGGLLMNNFRSTLTIQDIDESNPSDEFVIFDSSVVENNDFNSLRVSVRFNLNLFNNFWVFTNLGHSSSTSQGEWKLANGNEPDESPSLNDTGVFYNLGVFYRFR